MSHNGVALRAVTRSVAFLTAGALAVTALSGCSSEEKRSKPLAAQDIAPAARNLVADGGTLHWAVDAVPDTLNTFQSDADATSTTVAQAVLPSMYRLDANGRPPGGPAADVPAGGNGAAGGRPRLPGVGEGRRHQAQAGRAVQAEPAGRVE